jgi:exo-beta-1,3-glucanase (GH17 family)/cellulose synthase/poly-beta-1,6-N-acetylglucosamine synthase-like glycosyltransferase
MVFACAAPRWIPDSVRSSSTVSVLPPPSDRRPTIGLCRAAAIAALVGAVNLVVWEAAHPPLVLPDGPERVHGVAFNGFAPGEDPTLGDRPTADALAADLERVAAFARRVRTYSSLDHAEVPRIAGRQGLRVTAGAWLDRRPANNELELAAVLRVARERRAVDRVIVGNEAVLRGDLTPAELVAYLKRAKKQLRRVPVSTAEPWHVWLRYPELARNVDFLTVHLLPYWEGVPVERAVDYALARYDELVRAFPGKRIVIGEIGWPSRGDRVGSAVASPAAQARFVREFLARAGDAPLDYYLMEMFDQPWKRSTEGRTGPYWGAFHADRTPKFPLAGPVATDPQWQTKALAASALAAPFMLWFAFAFRRLRTVGLVAFCALVQGAAAALVWLATAPLGFYLGPAEWAALAALFPAAVAITVAQLAHGFEFVETLWRRAWRREFHPAPLAAGSREPFVSLHLPACNEPPEMMILTLDSLARLDYANFEVLVVINNTRDAALWRPVAAHVATLGPRFRFFELPQWPGFKAGALNFALRETDPRAALIGVVDADYAVDPGWLRNLVAHFGDSGVAVVQAPQAHREFAGSAFRRMASWEFDGFFRIGMHHRNERNAIIQHGTMTLVGRTALERAGGWAEWCICEDAELGLRLMAAGHELRYVDAVLGRGLTPADFAAYKAQRFRWAFGAMQILKRHWRSLLGASGLTAGQRFHFLTGWCPWLTDALHLLFAFGTLAWTAGVVAAPDVFPLPLAEWFVPVLGLLVFKALLGPVLYRARVPCGWADVLGASLASIALSHAAARGVLEGVARRDGTFRRTAKGANGPTRFKWLAAVREEALLLAALALAAGALIWRFGTGHPEAMLWSLVLAAQGLPYAAALVAARTSARSAGAPETTVAARPTAPESPAAAALRAAA